jgi:hypothetical protein
MRWLFWMGAAAYYLEFVINRPDHLNHFGHLLRATEFWMFSLPIVGLSAYLELMMRERAGLPRPRIGQLVPAPQSN